MIYFDYNATAPLHKNVIKKIQSLKLPNVYTGNGILLENQKIKLKQGKKK